MHPTLAEVRLKALEHCRPIPWQYTLGNYRFNIDLVSGSRITKFDGRWCFQLYRAVKQDCMSNTSREFLGETYHDTREEALELDNMFWADHQRWVSLPTLWQDMMKMFMAELTQ